MLQLCREVDESYSSGDYLTELYASLRDVLADSTWHERDASVIQLVSQCLIVELLLKGYSLDTIKELPASVFDRSPGIRFWHGFMATVNRSVAKSDGDLSTDDRLDAFRSFFSPESKPVYMIYQIEGLKGDTLDVNIGNVNIYSPKGKRYVKSVSGEEDTYRDEELFECAEDAYFANAAVRVDDFDTAASESTAVSAIEKALDLFRTFVASDVTFSVMSHRHIRVSLDGEYLGSGERSRPNTDAAYKHFRSPDLTDLTAASFDSDFFDTAGRYLFDGTQDAGAAQKLAYSMHWYRKAEESETPEDRLLGYWIALENIVAVEKSQHNVLLPIKSNETSISIIRELIPSLDACLFLSQSAAGLFSQLVRLMRSSTNGRPHLTLPEELADRAMLTAVPGTPIDLRTFLANLEDIADAIDRKTVKDNILDVLRLHTDIPTAKQQIDTRIANAKNELLLLYRFRNRIVHNAHYDDTILPYYVEKARGYAGNVLGQVLHDVCKGRESTVEKSLMRYYINLVRIKERLEKDVLVDFLTYNF